MAGTVRLQLPGLPLDDSPYAVHQKATIRNQAVRLTFPYVDADGDLTDLARDWVEQPRPADVDKRPLTLPGARKLAKASIKATFADPADSQRSVESELTQMRTFASSPKPLVISFGGLLEDTRWTMSGAWVIRDCSIHIVARAHGRNQVTRAEVDIDLLEANLPGWANEPPYADIYDESIAGAGTGAGVGRPRTYTVQEGDVLWVIAMLVYGYEGGSRWREIGDFNGITNPATQLTPGRVLLIP